jgi:hypothetical protein
MMLYSSEEGRVGGAASSELVIYNELAKAKSDVPPLYGALYDETGRAGDGRVSAVRLTTVPERLEYGAHGAASFVNPGRDLRQSVSMRARGLHRVLLVREEQGEVGGPFAAKIPDTGAFLRFVIDGASGPLALVAYHTVQSAMLNIPTTLPMRLEKTGNNTLRPVVRGNDKWSLQAVPVGKEPYFYSIHRRDAFETEVHD